MADDPLKNTIEDMSDQFKEMRESLDKIAENTEPAAEVAKKEISHAHRPNAPTPKVDLAKDTKRDILAALKNIRNQIVVTQSRENTMADVAAEALASGQGIAGAAKEALSFKKEKLKASFKRKFDPLNIVHRLTGGSKLATVLAGKVMGRSEQSIRSAAGLQQLVPSPTPFMEDQSAAPAPVASDRSIGLLEQMAGTLSQILDHMTRTDLRTQENETKNTGLLEEQLDYLKDAGDQAEDAASIEKARSQKGTATQVTKKVEVSKKDENGGWMDAILSWAKSMVVPILALIAAGTLLYSQWDKLKLSFSLMGETIQNLWQSIKDGLSSISAWVTDSLTSVYDSILDMGESVMESVKSLNPLYEAPTAEEKQTELKKKAAAGDTRAQRKLDKQVAELVAPKATVQSTVEKIATLDASRNLKGISQDKLAGEAENLRKGNYTKDAISALSGEKPLSGSPERITVGNALTQMAGKTYKELYKVSPAKDEEKRAERLPAVVQAAAVQLADRLISPAMVGTPSSPVASTPTEIPIPVLQTGQTLSQANDLQRNAAMSPITQATTGVPTIINNVKNNNTNSTTVHQNMSPARSEESSYLRSQGRGYVPA